jgi:DNA-binding CsgD family transcriptional regulator
MTKAQKSAKKAAKTRAARKKFRQEMSYEGAEVLELLAQGMTSQEVSDVTWVPVPSVAAYAANRTRGTYGQLLVDCNF